MTKKAKKPVSILLVFMMIVSLFAAVPMTVNAAPPGSEGYALTLYANNGTDQQYTTGKKFLENTFIWDPSEYGFTTPAGKTSRCWNTAADGTGTDYVFGSYYIHKTADLTLYAQWGYTVTWQDWDDTFLKAEVLAEGTTPTYDATPEKAEDENYTYTFAGWKDSQDTLYPTGTDLPTVSGDVTYTASFTAKPKKPTTTVNYDAAPTYTITIPESVTLSKDSTVNANITAADVLLEKGKKITVTLTGASNTTGEGTDTFNAKNNESVATYTIAAGNNSVALGGEVASFTTDGTQDLTFSVANTTGVIYAGAHTETLTFTVAVEDNT